MEETILRDTRWLIIAGIFFLGFGGSYKRLKLCNEAIAFGELDPSARKFCVTIKRVYWLSLVFAVVCLFKYWYPIPFTNLMWGLACIWIFFVIAKIGEGKSIFEKLKNK